ncbi:MAG: uroporphyrinogen decarboxylase/cobalamine-independent methonine synthase family protein [Bacillota bacterium]
MIFEPRCQATGIGSLPYLEPAQALKLVLETFPVFPHWPQLPRKGRSEHFIFQTLNILLELGIVKLEGDRACMDTMSPNWEKSITDFYTSYLDAEAGDEDALERFATPRESATGLYTFLDYIEVNGPGQAKMLKGQIPGPLSVALNLTDPLRKPAYYDEHLRDILVKTLALQARWQAIKLGACGVPVMLFVDDPAVAAWGTSTFITLTREDIVRDLAEIVEGIKKAGALAGAHCCAGVDWSMFMEAGMEVLSFDAYQYFPALLGCHEELGEYLSRGNILAWGLVPTDEKCWTENEESLARLYYQQMDQLASKGLPRDTLRRQTLITPACGAGARTRELAERIYHLTSGLSRLLNCSL